MKAYLFAGSFSLALLSVIGCSANTDDASSGDQSQDDIRASNDARTKEAQDLFHPAEDTLVASVPSSMNGLVQWNVYASDKGITVRGVSASKKIKVVYVQGMETDQSGQQKFVSAGFVNASDFSLPADKTAAAKLLNESVQTDIDKAAGTTPKSLSPLDACNADAKSTFASMSTSLKLVALAFGGYGAFVTAGCVVGAFESAGTSCIPLAILLFSGSGVAAGAGHVAGNHCDK